MNDWFPVTRKEVTEAYFPEAGDRISTLNGIEVANNNTVVIRHKHSDGDEWHTFITDQDTLEKHYEWENEDVESEEEIDEDSDSESEDKETETDEENSISVSDQVDKESDRNILETKFWDMLKTDLVNECKNRKIDHSGNKEDLVNRLVNYELNKQ